jgi:hypothetical protein
MISFHRRRPLVAGVLLGAVAVVAGVAIAGTTGIVSKRVSLGGLVQSVTACVHEGNGQLRVVADPSACGDDTAYAWSAVFANGPAPNVGDAFTTDQPNFVGLDPLSHKTVAQLPLPPGSYVFWANMEARETGAFSEMPLVLDVRCEITGVHLNFGSASRAADLVTPYGVRSHAGFGLILPIAVQAVGTLTQPEKVQLVCFNNSGRDSYGDPSVGVELADIQFTAIAVGKVTTVK